MSSLEMQAIVLAGGIPSPGDPLYPLSHGRPKALIEIKGRTLVQWVIDALDQAGSIEGMVVVGLDLADRLESAKPLIRVANRGSALANILAGAQKVQEIDRRARAVLSVSADIPALRGEMLDWLVGEVGQAEVDLVYPVIRRPVMEARFPNAQRSYLPLKDGDYCGADVFLLGAGLLRSDLPRWERILRRRKSALAATALIGIDLLFLLALRRLTLRQAEARVSRRLGIRGRLLPSPYAEIGMDVDRPEQLALLRHDVELRDAKRGS